MRFCGIIFFNIMLDTIADICTNLQPCEGRWRHDNATFWKDCVVLREASTFFQLITNSLIDTIKLKRYFGLNLDHMSSVLWKYRINSTFSEKVFFWDTKFSIEKFQVAQACISEFAKYFALCLTNLHLTHF